MRRIVRTGSRRRLALCARKSTLLGLAALAVAAATGARAASAEPAAALVMPFDATAGSVSFLVATHPAGATSGVRTHWAFWDESCTPLHAAIVCLPPDGSVVVDPTAVPARDGGTRDLSGRRGFVTVTAYDADDDGCTPDDTRRGTLARTALVGSFTLADLATGVSAGGPALAFPADASGAFVDLGAADDAEPDVHQAALRLQSFDPADLDVSRVILLALAERSGRDAFRTVEPGPAVDGESGVRAAVRFADRNGASITLPDARLGCATFTSLRREQMPTLLPSGGAGDAVASGGFLALESPRLGDATLGRTTWLAGFHAQGVGSFGVLAVGDTTLAARSAPTPSPATPTATPRPSPTPTPTARPTTTATTPTPRPTTGATPTPRTSATPRPTSSIVAPTATPAATASPAPTPGSTPSPSPTGGPVPTATPPGPTATPSPRPSTTAGPTATPSPAPTAPPPTATAPPTLSPRPTATAQGCGTVTVEVRTTYGGSDLGNVSGVAATLTYPPTVSIPGTGSDASVTARVGNVSGVGGLFQATDMETQLRAGLISIAASIPAGPFVRVQLDCTGGTAPPASAFGCTLEASTLDGTLLPGAACTTEVVS